MKRLIAVLLLCGCTPRPPLEEPRITSVPAALISHTGASFYILEGRDDFFDDSGNKILNSRLPRSELEYDFNRDRIPERQGVYWMGEQGLEVVLRYGLSRRQLRLIGHADFQPASGHPAEVTLFNSDPDPDRRATPHTKRTGFRIRLKATTCKKPDLVELDWDVEMLTDGPAPEDGAQSGQFPRTIERIHVGSGVLPMFATLMWFHRVEGDRGYYVLLRVSSVERA